MRRHELDPVSLVFGFAFTAAGLLFLAGRVDQAVRLRWLWPLLLLALGLGILLDLSGRRTRAAADAAEPPAAAAPSAEPEPPVMAERRAEPQPLAEPAEEPEPPAAERPAELEPPAAGEEGARTDELGPEGRSPGRER
jgi:hypothetical protein